MRSPSRIGVGLVALGLCLGGCFGPFNLTRRLYYWNSQVGEKWEREIVFLLLALTPVYGFVTFADAVVFNAMEFWTGNNPVSPPTMKKSEVGQTKRLARGEEAVVLRRIDQTDGRAMTMEFFRHGKPTGTLQFERRAGAPTIARDAQGRVVMTAETLADGRIVVTDGHDRQVASYSAQEVDRLLQ